jgi:hypothetical protein
MFQQYQVRASRSGDLTVCDFLHGGDDARLGADPEGAARPEGGLVETHGGRSRRRI